MKKLAVLVAMLLLGAPAVVPAQHHHHHPTVVIPVPVEVQRMIDRYCFPEIDPKIGGFWVIGPDDSITYSPVSCPAPVHALSKLPIHVTKIKHLTSR